MPVTSRLQKKYEEQIAPKLAKELGISNKMAVPRLKKIVLNIGLKAGLKDPKIIDVCEKTLLRITGQKPIKTLAKKSISNFKIRQGMVVGMKVTLRGVRMYDFLDKYITLTLPRVRDFRGISDKNVDIHGNLAVGMREFIAFPEIRPEDSDVLHGLEVAVATSAGDRKKGLALFRAIGFPFSEK
jgi:large subunit ribosomal protein L5